jgi:cell division protein FtsN
MDMDPRSTENVTEFVLDNRKLIVAFLMLAVVCGVFFAIGYMEGKRQVLPGMAGQTIPSDPTASTATPPAGENTPATQSVAAKEENREEPVKMDWYDTVQGAKTARPEVPETTSKKGQALEGLRAETPPAATKSTKSAPSKPKPPATKSTAATPPPKTVYTLQVGAFRRAGAAEEVAAKLKANGFSPTVDPPGSGSGLYVVKVGSYVTHSEASAIQLRIRKAGFDCILKSK